MAMLEWNLACKWLLLWEVLSRRPASRSSRMYMACKHRSMLLLWWIGLHTLLWPKRLTWSMLCLLWLLLRREWVLLTRELMWLVLLLSLCWIEGNILLLPSCCSCLIMQLLWLLETELSTSTCCRILLLH